MPRALAIGLAAALAAPAALLAQATLTGTLQVQRGQDRFPLPDCVVYGISGSNGPLVAEYSNEQGRFELAFPPDSQVMVGVDCAAYRLVSVDGRRSPLSRYDCSQPGPCAEVELVVEPLGAIEGHVLGPNGQPIEGVQLGLHASSSGRRGRHFQARSDDRGYFRLYHLPPGDYELLAISRAGLGNGIEWRAEPQRVEVAAGDVQSGFQVQFREVESVPMSGRIEGLPPGTKQVFVQYSSQRGNFRSSNGTMVQVDEEGRFQIDNLPRGQYEIEINLPGENGNFNQPVHIGSVDLTSAPGEVVLSRREPIELTGALEVHWPKRDDLPVPMAGQPVHLHLEREDGYSAGASARPPDFRFEVARLRPGRYRLGIRGPGGAKIERRVGETEWTPLDEIAVSEGDRVELDLRVRFEIGKLTVAVRPAGKPYVVGIRRDERTMLMPTDQNGRLVLDYFPSGDYKICAWADISPDEANDSATWERAGDAVREFRHDEGVDMEITLTAAP